MEFNAAKLGISEEKLTEYREAFAIMDNDNLGKIPTERLGTLMRCLNLIPTEAAVAAIIERVDVDKVGYLDFPSFLQVMITESKNFQIKKDSLREALRVFDKQGNGRVNAVDLRQYMTHHETSENLDAKTRREKENVEAAIKYENITEQEVDEMLKIADTNGDGMIDYVQFAHAITRVEELCNQ